MQNRGQSLSTLIRHPHWLSVKEVIAILNRAGFKAWLAGGCVRDGLLGRIPNDFDIATDARPEDVEKLFDRYLDVGKAFGVMVVPFPGGSVEIATFRSDGEYRDGRHPSQVEFSSPRQDALRRDFTVNAMFLDVQTLQVHDYVNGMTDLKDRTIRCVGDPYRRFDEDKLRPLRAVRFAAQLDFKIETMTQKAIQRAAPSIHVVSKERIQQELDKLILAGRRAEGFQILMDLKLAEQMFPTFDVQSGIKILKVSNLQTSSEPLWALFFAGASGFNDSSLDRVQTWLKEYKFSNHQTKIIVSLLRALQVFESQEAYLSEKLQHMDKLENSYALDLWLCWRKANGIELTPVESLRKEFVKRMEKGGHLPKPLITGEDLLQLGIKKGPRLGSLLKEAYDYQIQRQVSDKETLLSYVERTSSEDESLR